MDKKNDLNYIKKTKNKPNLKKDELTEVKNLLLRVRADFDNYRKRTQKEKELFGEYLNTDLILRIIPILDNFKLAIKHLPNELKDNDWVKGVWQIEKQLEQVLIDEGLSEIQSSGAKFDTDLHEAVEEVTSGTPPGIITEEVMKGYKLKNKIIRHAKVKVSKGEKENG